MASISPHYRIPAASSKLRCHVRVSFDQSRICNVHCRGCAGKIIFPADYPFKAPSECHQALTTLPSSIVDLCICCRCISSMLTDHQMWYLCRHCHVHSQRPLCAQHEDLHVDDRYAAASMGLCRLSGNICALLHKKRCKRIATACRLPSRELAAQLERRHYSYRTGEWPQSAALSFHARA